MSDYLKYRQGLKLKTASNMKVELPGKKKDEKEEEVAEVGKKPAKEQKKGKKMPARTKAQKKIMKDLKIAYGPYLEAHPLCAIQSPVCTQAAETVNHKAGRGIGQVLDQKTWEPSCCACNAYIEQHDAWAREHGHKISRLATPK